MRGLLTGLLVVALAFGAGTQALLPPFLAGRVAGALQESLGGAPVEVRLETFPAFRMLAGRVDRLTATVRDVTVDGLVLESLRLEAADVRLDVAALFQGRGWQPRPGDAIRLEAVVTETALTALVRERLPEELDVDVRLLADGLELHGRTTILGIAVDVMVRGRVSHDETGTQLVFVPEEIVVGGESLADWVADALRRTYTAAVDLGAAPVPMVVEEVVHEPGRLIITGRPSGAG